MIPQTDNPTPGQNFKCHLRWNLATSASGSGSAGLGSRTGGQFHIIMITWRRWESTIKHERLFNLTSRDWNQTPLLDRFTVSHFLSWLIASNRPIYLLSTIPSIQSDFIIHYYIEVQISNQRDDKEVTAAKYGVCYLYYSQNITWLKPDTPVTTHQPLLHVHRSWADCLLMIHCQNHVTTNWINIVNTSIFIHKTPKIHTCNEMRIRDTTE